MHRYLGTNGSMGLVTGNRYQVHVEQQDAQIIASVFLTNEPVKISGQDYADAVPQQRFMPYLFIPYDDVEHFKANWQDVGECRCTNPGKDDGQTTCWEHHDCSDGSCTHGE